jgi:putative oxidoreductase
MRVDLALLLLRAMTAAFMFFGHGMAKFNSFSTLQATFPDPVGLGPTSSLVLAIFAELICSALLFVGLATRVACVPLVITMLVAAGWVHAEDPWQKKELALLYVVPFLAILLAGPGMFSIDALLKSRPRMLRP